MDWICKEFNELSLEELYNIYYQRQQTFIVEQSCCFCDADDYDKHALHLFLKEGDKVKAYLRIIGKGKKYENEASIGRVLVTKDKRGQGLASVLMEKAHEILFLKWGKSPIKIMAQSYLKNFYGSLGYKEMSEPYQQDGIEHIDMRRDILS